MNETKIPLHLAFIMDGNRRWAKMKGLPTLFGHKKGGETLERLIAYCSDLGVKVMTVYAFSSENWKREEGEVNGLVSLMISRVDKLVAKGLKNNLKYKMIGDVSKFPDELQKKLKSAEERSKNNTGMVLNVALSYGGRDEIVRAANKCKDDGKKITEENIALYLDTAKQPEPDLIIRTGGEQRLSNFLTWQSVYSEFYFTEILWPDFKEKELEKALMEYSTRNRRFGK